MLKNLPFVRTRTIVCPDGTTHTIQNDIEKLFPLSVSDRSANLDSELSIPETVDAKAAVGIKNAIKSVMVSIDDTNGSLILEQRGAYSAYAAKPCGSHEWYKKQIEDISARRQRLQEQKNMLNALIAMAQTPGVEVNQLVQSLQRLVENMTPEAASVITLHEMDRSEETAHEMIEGSS